jgi:REP element-mobilizing transposase RayT
MRKTTPLEPDRCYHIYTRGVNKMNIFSDDRTRFKLFKNISKYLYPISTVYAWCFLNNHFHILIQIKTKQELKSLPAFKNVADEDEMISIIHQKFSNMLNSYVRYYNLLNNRTGPLFDSRFKRKLVDSQEYFQNVLIYIHNNPVHHKICRKPSDYNWSSYEYYMNEKKRLQFMEEVIADYGGIEAFRNAHEKRSLYLDAENDFV